ncbi:hypothetical protein pb186bvf_019629 [Paramecium bursaria]
MQNNPAYHILIDNKDKHVLECEIDNIAQLRQLLIEFDLVKNPNIEIKFFKEDKYFTVASVLEQITNIENFEFSKEHPILVNYLDDDQVQKGKVEKQDNKQEELANKLAKTREELEQAKQQIFGLQQQIEKIKEQKQEQQDENIKQNKKLQQIIDQQQQDIFQQQIKISELEHFSEQIEKIKEQKQEQQDEHLQQNKKLQQIIESQQQDIFQQQIKLSELEHSNEQVQKYKKEVEQYQQNIVQQQMKISMYDLQSERLQKLLEQSSSVRESTNKMFQQLEDEKKSMEQINAELINEIQQLKQKLDATRKEKIELTNTVFQIEDAHRQLLLNSNINVGSLIDFVKQHNPQQLNNNLQENDKKQNQEIKIQQLEIKHQSEIKVVKSEISQKEIDSKIDEINQLKKTLEQTIDNELNYQIPHDYQSEKVYINFVCRKPGHEGNPIGQLCLQDRCKQTFGCLYCSSLHAQNHTTMPLDQFFNHIDQVKQTLNLEDYWEKIKFQYKQYKESSFLMILKIKEQNQNITKQINSVFKYLQTFNESDPQRLDQYKKMVLDNGKEIQQVMDQSIQTIMASTEIVRKLNLVNCHFCHQQCDQNNEEESEVFLSECGHSLHRQCYVQLVEKQIMNTQAKCLCHSKLSLAILSNKNNNKESKFKIAILDNQLDKIRGDLSIQILLLQQWLIEIILSNM